MNRKLTLELEALSVDSFSTTPPEGPSRCSRR